MTLTNRERDSGWASFLDLRKESYALSSADLYEVRIARRGDTWLATLKAVKNGRYVVAFVGGDSYQEVIFNVGLVSFKEGFRWYSDKYPPKSPP